MLSVGVDRVDVEGQKFVSVRSLLYKNDITHNFKNQYDITEQMIELWRTWEWEK